MNTNQIAAQLYTLRDFLKTPADIAASLKRVRAIGYQAVQVSGMGEITEDELNRILDGEGLVCCATHEPGPRILDEPERVAERLAKLNCRHTAYPYPANFDLSDYAQVKTLAEKLNHSGEVLRQTGRVLSYHNHSIEFMRVNHRPVLAHLYDLTDPQNLQAELDTYWVQAGGCNPAEWCEQLAGRLPLLHMKDYAVSGNQPVFAAIGAGNLDWPAIISAAEMGGCEWFIVEQDTCPGDPFDALAESFAHIKENLLTL